MANTIQTQIAAGTRSSTASDPGSAASGALNGKGLSKDLFLQLMVAQLRNQNPMNPVDGTDFLAQLSQISGVEQMVEMRQQLEEIRKLLATPLAAANAGSAQG